MQSLEVFRKHHFQINPTFDYDILFDRREISDWLTNLDKWLSTNSKIVTVFYGDHQSGKTHLLTNIYNLVSSKDNVLTIYIDIGRIRNEFSFYKLIIEEMMAIGIIQDILSNYVSTKNEREIKNLFGGETINWVSKEFNYDANSILDYIRGNKLGEGKLWQRDIKKNPFFLRNIIKELLTACYKINNSSYPIIVIDSAEDVFNKIPRGYLMPIFQEEIKRHMQEIMRYSSVFLSLDTESFDAYKTDFPTVSAGYYDEIQLTNLSSNALKVFFTDMLLYFIDSEKVREILSRSPHVGIEPELFPFTTDSANFILNLQSIQPGILLSLIDKTVKDRGESSALTPITREQIERAFIEHSPYSLTICPSCTLLLNNVELNVRIASNGAPKILSLSCPNCRQVVSHFSTYILQKIVVDTSALIDQCVSPLFSKFPELGTTVSCKIMIPRAVDSELSNMEKRGQQGHRLSRQAIREKQRLIAIARTNFSLVENVGREPTTDERFHSKLNNDIDKLIIAFTKKMNSTILTCDQGMYDLARSQGVFAIYIKR